MCIRDSASIVLHIVEKNEDAGKEVPKDFPGHHGAIFYEGNSAPQGHELGAVKAPARARVYTGSGV